MSQEVGSREYRERSFAELQELLLRRRDKIIVRNLSVTANAGRDAWGRKKEQPALVSVAIHLASNFESASSGDTVDSSTIHYGQLSKLLVSEIERRRDVWHSTHELVTDLEKEVGRLADDSTIQATEVDILYPKGTLLGEGSGLKMLFYNHSPTLSDIGSVYYLKNIKIPCIIGVNEHERRYKQPVVVNVSLYNYFDPDEDCFNAELVLTEIVGISECQTLESLATKVANGLMKLRIQVTQEEDPSPDIEVRVEKPVAVPLAEAAAIEIFVPGRTLR